MRPPARRFIRPHPRPCGTPQRGWPGGCAARALLCHPLLDAAAGCRVWVKPEPLQVTGSFKLRGALNALLTLPLEARAKGVVTHSSGNHGQAVAAAAAMLGVSALVAMPADAPAIKRDATARWGAAILPSRPADDRPRGAGAPPGRREWPHPHSAL